MTLRSKLIRTAAQLPPGKERTAVLNLLRKAALDSEELNRVWGPTTPYSQRNLSPRGEKLLISRLVVRAAIAGQEAAKKSATRPQRGVARAHRAWSEWLSRFDHETMAVRTLGKDVAADPKLKARMEDAFLDGFRRASARGRQAAVKGYWMSVYRGEKQTPKGEIWDVEVDVSWPEVDAYSGEEIRPMMIHKVEWMQESAGTRYTKAPAHERKDEGFANEGTLRDFLRATGLRERDFLADVDEAGADAAVSAWESRYDR